MSHFRCVVCYHASDRFHHFVFFRTPRHATLCKWCLDYFCAHRDLLQKESLLHTTTFCWETLLTPVRLRHEHVYPFAPRR